MIYLFSIILVYTGMHWYETFILVHTTDYTSIYSVVSIQLFPSRWAGIGIPDGGASEGCRLSAQPGGEPWGPASRRAGFNVTRTQWSSDH
jgi:hypothetical protein